MRNTAMRQMTNLHFIGIGGVGMSGIAEVLIGEGYTVSGSDLTSSKVTNRLKSLGARIFIGHDTANVTGADVVVISAAVDDQNSEVVAAKEMSIPIVPRASMLAELMRFREGIAIAGTHGKTTTTSLTASILAEAGLDPTFVIGGKLISAQANARLGQGKYLVAEADESDASFLFLSPTLAVVTNIDSDHLENYQSNFDNVVQAFLDFLHRLPFYGLAVLCIDDDKVNSLLDKLERPRITYGFSQQADYRLSDYKQMGCKAHFNLSTPEGNILNLALNMPGQHNALNAAAAVVVALELGASLDAIETALNHFQGVGRRFEHRGELKVEAGCVQLIDDYAHHPVEIAVTVDAARASWPDRRVVLMFQPHRFTRTRDLFDSFCQSLCKADALVLLDVYPAGESVINGATSHDLAHALRQRKSIAPVVVSDFDEVRGVLNHVLQDGDILLTMGAGSIGGLINGLAEQPILCSKKVGLE